MPTFRAYQVQDHLKAPTCSQNLRVSGLCSNCLWRVPWFHENALLLVDSRDDGRVDDGASCAAGDLHLTRSFARQPLCRVCTPISARPDAALLRAAPGRRRASSGLGAGMDDNPARETQREQFLMLS